MQFRFLFYFFLAIFITVTINSCSFEISKIEKKKSSLRTLSVLELKNLNDRFREVIRPNKLHPYSEIDSVKFSDDTTKIYINYRLIEFPIRHNTINILTSFFSENFFNLSKDKIELICQNRPLQFYIPNYYRDTIYQKDSSRFIPSAKNRIPLVSYLDKKSNPTKGLQNRNLVIWNSHGWYYSHASKRWEWQRPRLFQTVEDLLPTSFMIPYLIPMLESAGATVFLPRERDIQKNEIILDFSTYINNPNNLPGKIIKSNSWQLNENSGFSINPNTYITTENPFENGACLEAISAPEDSGFIEWTPNIPEQGEYSVYVSYQPGSNNASDVEYTINHSGGRTCVKLNQLIGGNTWTYIGTYRFNEGIDSKVGSVRISNKSSEINRIISAGAVRFGGGMGNISRNGSTSGRRRFFEGARYYLQYLGMPDSVVYSFRNDDDYTDDYVSRAEYANYLNGAPLGTSKSRDIKGLQIPIDLTLAFHTDAGITNSDSSIGTLVIYSSQGIDSAENFPNGVSRFSNRDFADILQTEILKDIKYHFDKSWTQRELRNALYSEAVRPNMPGALLELLSHQNLFDMEFALDPRFKHYVSRAIYKAILKFLASSSNDEYVVSPLPIKQFRIEQTSNSSFKLFWTKTIDPLESTAEPRGYIVYTRLNNNGFDNGILTLNNFIEVTDIISDSIYSFKITAVNEGGESMPSEILSASISSRNKSKLLVVNAFDRIAAPRAIKTENFSGFVDEYDQGVPHGVDFGYVGSQYDFSPNSEFISNDMPGHGASNGNFETELILGNNFDFTYLHGKSLNNLGYSFVSSSDEAVEDGLVELSDYNFIDFIFGEEKSTQWVRPEFDSLKGIQFTTFTEKMKSVISNYLNENGNIFLSGAYIASDPLLNRADSIKNSNFIHNLLKYNIASPKASKNGRVESFSTKLAFPKIKFNTEFREDYYCVESPDGLIPMNGSIPILKYSENNIIAGTIYKNEYGVVALGFPFETIIGQQNRDEVMKKILELLKIN